MTMTTSEVMAAVIIELLTSRPSTEKSLTGACGRPSSAKMGWKKRLIFDENAEGTSLRESNFRQAQDYGKIACIGAKKANRGRGEQRLKQRRFECRDK